jgi:hypothetical protein
VDVRRSTHLALAAIALGFLLLQACEDTRTPAVPPSALGPSAMERPDTEGAGRTIRPPAPLPDGATRAARPRILVIGDSLAYQGIVSALETRLRADGIHPGFIGTVRDVGGAWCEGRSSWEFSHFTHRQIDVPLGWTAPPIFPVTGVAGPGAGDGYVTTVERYLALDPDGERWSYNPFLRAATPGDAPALVKNGFVFDVRFYLDRFGFGDPDVVLIVLGTNDTLQNDAATATENAVEGLDILVAQTGAALPAARIGIVLNGFPGSALWRKHLPFVEHVHQAYGARTGEHLHVLPVYSVVDPASMPDGIHPDEAGRAQWVELLLAFVGGFPDGRMAPGSRF